MLFPSSPIKIWGKSVQGLMSYDLKNKQKDKSRLYNLIYIYRDIIILLLQTFIEKIQRKYLYIKNHRVNKWLFAIYSLLAPEYIKLRSKVSTALLWKTYLVLSSNLDTKYRLCKVLFVLYCYIQERKHKCRQNQKEIWKYKLEKKRKNNADLCFFYLRFKGEVQQIAKSWILNSKGNKSIKTNEKIVLIRF